MIIYVDLIFFINFAYDFLLLLTVGIVLKRKTNIYRHLLSATFGGLSIFLLFLPGNEYLIFGLKLIVSVIMCLISFKYISFRYTLNNLSYLYMTSIILAGFLYYLDTKFSYSHQGLVFFFNGISVNYLLLMIVAPIILVAYIISSKKLKSTYNLYYHLEIYFDDEAIFNSDVPAGVFESNILTQYDVFFDQNGNVVNNFEITCDTTWIAKNEYKLVVSSQYGKDGAYLKEETLYNGDSFTLPSFASYEVDMTTYIIEYTFLGYYLNGDKTTFIPSGTKVMSIQNATYIAQWKAEEYCYISFDTTWAKPSGWLNGGLGSYSAVSGKETPTPIEPVKVARNKEWTATGAYNSSCAYTYKAMGVPATYTFFVASWNQSGSNTCEFRTTTGKKDVYHNNYTFVPKGHTTLNAHWDASRNW